MRILHRPFNPLLRLYSNSIPHRPLTRGSMSVSNSYDVAVIGVGAMGSAALYHGARAGLKMLGLEQFQIGHRFGSSHGYTRIYRVAHYNSQVYQNLAYRSGLLFEQLEEDCHQKLLHRCGNLNIGPFSVKLGEELDKIGYEYQMFNAKELHEAFPGFQLEDVNAVALLDPLGGFLESDLVIQQQVSLAKKMNAAVLEGCKVHGWSPDGSGVRVETDRGVYFAQKLILSTGAWIAESIPELKTVCIPLRQVVGWYDSKPSDLFIPENFPAFISLGESNFEFYGVPAFQNQGMKLARFHMENKADPDNVDRSLHQADDKELENNIKVFFRPEEHKLKEASTCLFTRTPDDDFIIDHHPLHPQVLVCSPCSGHGFKHSAAIGQILIQMVIEDIPQDSQQLLKPFRLFRSSLNLKNQFY